MNDKYCLQCANDRALDRTHVIDTSDLKSGFSLWTTCKDCGDTVIDKEGNCLGLWCAIEKHGEISKITKFWCRVKYMCQEGWYALKCYLLPSYHFHYLDLRNAHYQYGWRDTDARLLFAAFKLLEEFVEKENGLVELWYHVESDPNNKKAFYVAKTAQELYDWWKNDYPKDSFGQSDYHKQYALETKMLHKLISIRQNLWT